MLNINFTLNWDPGFNRKVVEHDVCRNVVSSVILNLQAHISPMVLRRFRRCYPEMWKLAMVKLKESEQTEKQEGHSDLLLALILLLNSRGSPFEVFIQESGMIVPK